MLFYPDALLLLFVAILLDAVLGDPEMLWRRVSHPVVYIGRGITALETRFNNPDFSDRQRKAGGVLTLLLLVLASVAMGIAIHWIAHLVPFGEIVVILVAAILIAQKSLYQHVAAVRDGLQSDGLEGGRRAVAMIVGRDPQQLDEAGVSRAAIESCAENFSDGVVAPVFWFALLGLPGLIAYKAVNTADSMIGHKTDTYRNFGWASARFDDLINLPASRLAGLLFTLSAPCVGGSPRAAFKAVRRDAGKHRSPNAGWPEAAMAGALGLALAGPRAYPGYTVNDPYMNRSGRKNATADDITSALKILVTACALQALIVLLLAFWR
ncbi:adenosylcobinamide-phosphate synthase CbiB [uncultured Roseibium sp.]|uniref:adenosylcobinamide-phosphate synthase CbiB n=1 Tax=uncultured Roseibium sp. TaxID=1936171 RepID=UPI002598F231|nr:adenosylcobinamide-phosphate synthase CbiB [uncultured Roseibium sp.]